MAGPERPRHSLRYLIGELLTSLAIGLGIGSLIAVASPTAPRDVRLISILFAGLVGVGIASIANLITWASGGRLERLSGMRKAAARTIQLFVSGLGAWLFAGMIVQSLFPRFKAIDLRAYPYILVTCGLAITIGFVFISFDVLRKRLAASVARLKEAEFAERELQLARDLQSRLLPPPEMEGEGYRVAARNLAARVVAGDFFDVFRLADGAVGLTVADVAGKGMAASLIMASAKARLALLAADRPAEETVRELNRVLAAELSAREFVALVFARYEPASGTVTLANAGLPDPYLIRKGEPPIPLGVSGPRLPLGVRREVAYEALQLRLEPGDRLLLLTDGLAEAPTPAGEPLGYAALAGLMTSAGTAALPLAWLDNILERVRQATAPALEDDWTALVLERI